ncbi:MAG: anion transporter [Candidatus Aenigmarchaeota archaeon]|nr:anion transporter [Candidatus Aenigmarchaeota archaeon]
MFLPVAVLFAVFVLTAFRNIGGFRLPMWQVMLGGALAVLLAGQITLPHALAAVNFDVLLFLSGMFIVGRAMEESGYLSHLAYTFFRRARTADMLVLFILFVMGIASAFLLNDMLAIIGTPVVLLLARKNDMPPVVLLLALAFAVTIGSVMSPIGNPQNLLIATQGNMHNPFATFFSYLFIPTIINLLLAFAVLKIFYRSHFHRRRLNHAAEPIKDHALAQLAKVSLLLVLLLVAAKIALLFAGVSADFRLTYIALIAALPVVALSPRRIEIVRSIDWQTLVFFASMFVLMASVWETGFFQSFINGYDITSVHAIFIVSVLLSQVLSNVPLVALYLPLLGHLHASTASLMALAAGSTIAGNALILGAASNVIIIQRAEKQGTTISFLEFAKIGIPLTIINVAVYWLFLAW